ncbi:MAG: RloB family protein [Candidatus Margulisiibacteriota bacterium]
MGKKEVFKPRSYLHRVTEKKDPRKTFLIVCEGEKTEPLYFDAFELASVTVIGTGFNTHSLVDEAIRLKKHHPGKDEIWCVFDRDSFDARDIRKAIQKADKNNIRIAYSNESFELWYLLHFNYMDTQLNREAYIEKLTNQLGKPYSKNESLYRMLKNKQHTAILNSKKLLKTYTKVNPSALKFGYRYPDLNPVSANPMTTVFELVEELLRAMNRK